MDTKLNEQADAIRGNTVASPASGTPFSENVVAGFVAITDGLVVFCTGLAIYFLYVGWHDDNYARYLSALSIQTIVVLTTFFFVKAYEFESVIRPVNQIKTVVTVFGLTFLVMVALAFSLKISTQFSRVWTFAWFSVAPLTLLMARGCAYFILRKWAQSGSLTRNIVIVGAGTQAQKLLEHLDSTREPWNKIAGIFDDRVDRMGPTLMGYPVLGNLDDLLEFARRHRIDDIIVTLPWSADQRLFGVINKLRELPVHVRLGFDLVGFMFPRRRSSFIAGVPMLDIASKPLAGGKIVVKALEDKGLALFFLILLAPLLLFIALIIKLESRGPVLFRQPRYGFNNKVFSVYKFRTMFHDRPPEAGVPQARRDDPRVTPFGAFLRRSSLDELPQLLNVLDGSMSLVGPRPHAVAHNKQYAEIIEGYFGRHRMKPGITGWAQVNGLRGETKTRDKMEARVEYDIYYIENWSLLFDLQILAMTVWVIFTDENAY
jgi:Undecaprenyl-phosphate glucose phosphotransferase